MTRSGLSSSAWSTACWPSPTSATTDVPLLLEHLLEVEADERLVLGDEDTGRLAAHGREPSDVGAARTSPLGCSDSRRATGTPPYPNRQRERIQNPRSVRSSRTGGTVHIVVLPDRTAASVPFPASRRARSVASSREPPAPAPRDLPRGACSLSQRLRALAVRRSSRTPPGPARRADTVARVTEPVPHMTPEQFRQHGHEVVDWIADYWTRIGSLPGALAGLPRRGPRRRCRPTAPEQGEPFSAVLADLDRVVAPRRHALAAPRLLRLLPGQHLRAVRARRPGLRRARRPGHVLGDQPRGHRARAARHGLARRPARPAGVLPLRRHRRRRRPGLQLRRQPGRPARRPAPGQHGRDAPARRRPRPGHASTSRPRRTRSMEKAVRIAGLGTDAVRIVEVDGDLAMRPRGAGRAARAGRRPRLHPGAGLRHGRDDVDDRRRPARRARARSARSTASGCTSTPPTPGSAPSSRSCGRCRPASSGPTATPPTRTSGCSPASTPRCSGSPTGRRSPARCRSCRSTCATPRPTPAPSSTSATGRSRSAAGSARSSCGSSSAGTAPRACARTSAAHVALAQELAGWAAADERFDVATPHPLVAGLPAAALGRRRRRRRRHHDAAGAAQRRRRGVPDPHHRRRHGGAPGGHRRARHHPRARRAGVGAAARGPRLAGRRLRGGGRRAPGGRAPRARAAAEEAPRPPRRPRRPRPRPQATAAEAAERDRALDVPPVEVRPAWTTPTSGDASAAQATAPATGPQPPLRVTVTRGPAQPAGEPEQALLGDGGDVGAVGGPDLAEAQRPAAGRRRAVGLVEEPLVGAHRPVEPDRVVEARARRSRRPSRRRAGRARRESSVRSLTNVSAAACTAPSSGSRPATRIQARVSVSGGGFGRASNGSSRSRCSTARPIASMRRRPVRRGGRRPRPARAASSGRGHVGHRQRVLGHRLLARGGSRRSARRSRRPRPCGCCQATTRRVLNDRPSRIRSTS